MIDSMYVTHGAQFSKYTTPYESAAAPLVPGHDAEVRVFAVTAPGNTCCAKASNIHVYFDGREVMGPSPSPDPYAFYGPPAYVKTGLPLAFTKRDEIDPCKSYNVTIPGSWIKDGATSIRTVAIFTDDHDVETAAKAATITSVIPRKVLSIRLVPIDTAASANLINTNLMKQFFPIDGVKVTVADRQNVKPNVDTVSKSLQTLRSEERYTGIYLAIVAQPLDDTTCGFAYQNPGSALRDGAVSVNLTGGCAAIGSDQSDASNHLVLHEVGHIVGLRHAPCSKTGADAADPDPWFDQHSKGGGGKMVTDGWRFDVNTNERVPDGDLKIDFMAYCPNYFVSAHDRQLSATTFARYNFESQPSPQAKTEKPVVKLDSLGGSPVTMYDSLYLTSKGTIDGFTAGTELLPVTNEHGVDKTSLLIASDKSGLTVFQRPLDVERVNDGRELISIFTLPSYQALAVQHLEWSYLGKVILRKDALPAGPLAAMVTGVDASHVRLSFDSSHFASVGVSASTFLDTSGNRGPSGATLEESADTVYLDFNDGVKTVAWHVKVPVRGRGGVPIPAASFYQNFRSGGKSVTLHDNVADLSKLNFSSTISSATIAAGTWHACTGVEYTGKCIDLAPGTYPDFGKLGFNDAIKSLEIL